MSSRSTATPSSALTVALAPRVLHDKLCTSTGRMTQAALPAERLAWQAREVLALEGWTASCTSSGLRFASRRGADEAATMAAKLAACRPLRCST